MDIDFIEQREEVMPEGPPSKDEALEALDFIINVLKEHEKDLDRLIDDLGTITDRLGNTGGLSGKIEKVEERLATLQDEIANLIKYMSAPRETVVPLQNEQEEKLQLEGVRGPPVILRCKHWEDFQTLARGAQTLSFLFKEAEKTFQVDALKNNQVITYSGEPPKETSMLKRWLSKELDIAEQKILEGILAIG